MPELPEVETVKRTLLPQIEGKQIADIVIDYGKIIKAPEDTEIFKMKLIGETFTNVRRRGKFLLFDTEHDTIVAHLRMEGKFFLANGDEPVNKHTHIRFLFTDGSELRYQDVRKFGTMHLFTKGEEMNQSPLAQLGPEPFEDRFTSAYLAEKLGKTSRKIKSALLDQNIFVGLGNIYVDETLHRAKIHPEQIASSLTKQEVKTIHKISIDVLQKAIDKRGSSIRSYVDAKGDIGEAQTSHLVYGKKGVPCTTCTTPIEKIKLGGRGTHFCPHCQRRE